ncbi:hypothetical protein SCUP234_12580 [Seiridium cupressi]
MAPLENSESVDWNTDKESGFVAIHNRDIFLGAQGPPRRPGQPVIICEAGHGDSSYVWAAVQSKAGEFVRTFAYDRAGMGQSHPGPSPRTAAAAARDLSDTLDEASILGPYILVCHSYGGLLAREFLHIRNGDVAGIIFIDTITEHYTSENILPMTEFDAVLGQLDYWDVIGMAKRHVLRPEEWKMVKKHWSNDEATSAAEASSMPTTEQELADKEQFDRQAMGHRPVVVIKGNATQDFKNALDAGEAAGNGTESQRATLRKFITTSEEVRERHQREQLRLSSNSRYVVARHGHHAVQFSEPELIVAEIKAMLESLSRQSA